MVQNTRFNLKPQEVPPKRSLLPKLSEANPAPEKGMNNAFPGSLMIQLCFMVTHHKTSSS